MIKPYSKESGVVQSGTYNGYHFVIWNGGSYPTVYVQYKGKGIREFFDSCLFEKCNTYVPKGTGPKLNLIPQYQYIGKSFNVGAHLDSEWDELCNDVDHEYTVDELMDFVREIVAEELK